MKLFLVVSLSFVLNSCSFLKQTKLDLKDKSSQFLAITSCKFELTDVHKYVSFTQNTSNIWNYVVDFVITIDNPSKHQINLGRYSLDVFVNEKWLCDIQMNDEIILKPEKSTTLNTKAILSPNDAAGLLFKKLFDKKIEYRINGTFYLRIGQFEIPFTKELVKFTDK